MDAGDIPGTLVEPAAGMVDQPCGVQAGKLPGNVCRIELSPALIEGNPADNTGMYLKRLDSLLHFQQKIQPPFLIPSGKERAAQLSVRNGERKGVHQRGQIGDEPVLIGCAAADHVLPDQHPQPVAVIIPSLRLHLYMLSKHVEAQLLHGDDIEYKRLVAGSGVQAVRPVALIQHAGLKIGTVVQKNPPQPISVCLHIAFSHGKIAFHPVLFRLHRQVVEERIFRRPWMKGRKRDGRLFSGGKGKKSACILCGIRRRRIGFRFPFMPESGGGIIPPQPVRFRLRTDQRGNGMLPGGCICPPALSVHLPCIRHLHQKAATGMVKIRNRQH